MIPVTKPFLPPKHTYDEYVTDIWNRSWLTNNGPLVNELETKLKDELDLQQLLYVGNGTIAIQMAIKALDLKGDILTTPFSYVATTSSIAWEGCNPIFVDIDENSWNIDPHKIESAITPTTKAILATHVFGNPCDVITIAQIAKKHNLYVIYDAAHCFGARVQGKSVFSFGDISTTSFHATKLFHTTEGGAVFANDLNVFNKLFYLRNFGHAGPEKFAGIGINGKNSEFHAAMGLCNLPYVAEIIDHRRRQYLHYKTSLAGQSVQFQEIYANTDYNYAYFPVVFDNEETTLKIQKVLNDNRIYPRRYFYPSLNTLNYVTPQDCPVSYRISGSILCLPVYHDLTAEEQDLVCKLIKKTLSSI